MITREKIILLGILACIGIGMVLAAYFIGNLSDSEELNYAGDKDIAIILKPTQEVYEEGCGETGACAINGEEGTDEDIKEDEYEAKPEESKLKEPDIYGDSGVSENETLALTGFAEAGDGRGTGSGGVEKTEYAVEQEAVQETQETQEAVPTPAVPAAPPSLESLKQNITANYMNVLVMNKGEVMSNTTVNLENE